MRSSKWRIPRKKTRYALVLLLSSASAVSLSACGVTESGDEPTMPPSVVDYALQLTSTAAGEFVILAAGEDPQELESPVFGPMVGYPPAEEVNSRDFGVVERGSFIVVSTAVGNLQDMVATIDGSPTAVEVDADGRIGIPISFELESDAHSFVLTDPTGEVIVARGGFTLQDVILGG